MPVSFFNAGARQMRSSDVWSSANTEVAPMISVMMPMAEASTLLPGSLALLSNS